MNELVELRNVCEDDALLLQTLASECPPLDIHTPYTYWVIARFFGRSSFIAEISGEPVGYITSVDNGNELLIWQIGLKEKARGKGISEKLIRRVISDALAGGKKIFVSIDKNNQPSNGAFSAYCRRNGLKMTRERTVTLTSAVDPVFTESEELFRIEPDAKENENAL